MNGLGQDVRATEICYIQPQGIIQFGCHIVWWDNFIQTQNESRLLKQRLVNWNSIKKRRQTFLVVNAFFAMKLQTLQMRGAYSCRNMAVNYSVFSTLTYKDDLDIKSARHFPLCAELATTNLTTDDYDLSTFCKYVSCVLPSSKVSQIQRLSWPSCPS